MHTSGSSGRPKCVLVPFDALANAVTGVADFLGLTGADRVLQFAQPAFDVFFEEVIPTLSAGGCLVLPGTDTPDGADLAALIAFGGVSVLNLPTAYLTSVLAELSEQLADRAHRLRCLVVGGERLPAEIAGQVTAGLAGVELINAYGVTESTITSTMMSYSGTGDEVEVPLGTPLPGVVVAVIDPAGSPLPAGVAGEIVLGGPGRRPST